MTVGTILRKDNQSQTRGRFETTECGRQGQTRGRRCCLLEDTRQGDGSRPLKKSEKY